MPGYRGFLCLLFGTSLALIQRSPQQKQAKIQRKISRAWKPYCCNWTCPTCVHRFALRALHLYYKCWITLWPCTDILRLLARYWAVRQLCLHNSSACFHYRYHACATATATCAKVRTYIYTYIYIYIYIYTYIYIYIYIKLYIANLKQNMPIGLTSACHSTIIASLETSVPPLSAKSVLPVSQMRTEFCHGHFFHERTILEVTK